MVEVDAKCDKTNSVGTPEAHPNPTSAPAIAQMRFGSE